ncbi:bifunctional hydroxymethylpyrimidine kinase/phosphomethylpyrimidine kinase [Brachybacterium sp. AOP43-C2-M15]|uniref:bifunctional hydroxymethylpyrimidine kinase/phosphomethylpyrimidine kinase n=1 Tax=Brachybacterium sp. AOP43-C2-M15 TaxID=3457661 RepID=UPI0040347A62
MTPTYPARVPRVLSIAGTDPSGGAGTAADLKSIAAAGGYGMSAVTALVAQNTRGVREIHVPPASFLTEQLRAVGEDVRIDAVKTGMLATAEIIRTVAAWLDGTPPPLLVVDPVMVATSGDSLLEPEAEEAMIDFCRRADVVTPNIEELARLTGREPAADEQEALAQASRWSAETGVAVVVKTGHLRSRRVTNSWVRPDGTVHPVRSTRLEATSTHGTGCSLSSALATRLAAGDGPEEALAWSTRWLHEAIAHGEALRVGTGHGPVDHFHRARRLQSAGESTPWLVPAHLPAVLGTVQDVPAAPGREAPGTEPVRSAVPPAGPWTAALWAAGEDTARAIAGSEFVRALVDGSLDELEFAFYLDQDAHYLRRYSRSLAALAARSSDPAAQELWSRGATDCLTVESELHRSRLGDGDEAGAGTEPSPVTSAYTDFLLAAALGEDLAVGAAAVLPCYWLYAQAGAALPAVPPDHPYADWLDTYRDPGFVTATQEALAQVERELEAASPRVRAAALRAYLLACRHELEFFDQALRLGAAAPARHPDRAEAR